MTTTVDTTTGSAGPSSDATNIQEGGAATPLSPDAPGKSAGDAGDAGGEKKKSGPALRDLLIKMMADIELFLSSDGIAFATVINVLGRYQTLKVKSQEFRSFLGQRFFQRTKKAPSHSAVDDAIDHAEGKARFQGAAPVEVLYRLAYHQGALYIDLGNDDYQVVEVTSKGWKVIDNHPLNCPVKFRRHSGMLPLPIPEKGGNLNDLRRFVNVFASDIKKVIGFIVGAFRWKGPYPVLELTGEQGSAKSTTAEMILRMIDPSNSARRSAPKNEQDLAIALANTRVVMFDNVSTISPTMSDLLCRASTGGAYSTRKLYSDDEEKTFIFQRPVMLTGINDMAKRADLLERTIMVELPKLTAAKRQSEDDLWREFHAAHPKLFGALLDAVACAMDKWDDVSKEEWPRLADQCRWVTAAEPALGWEHGTFLHYMRSNQVEAAEWVLESERPLITALKKVAQGTPGGWSGTATQLFEALRTGDVGISLPNGANALAQKLRRLAPPLRTIGVHVDFYRQGHDSAKFIGVRWEIPKTIDRADRIDGEAA